MMKIRFLLPSVFISMSLLSSSAISSELVLDLSSPLSAGESFAALMESESHSEALAMTGALLEYAEGRLRNFARTGHASESSMTENTELTPEQFVENLRPLEGLTRRQILAKYAVDMKALEAMGEL